MDGKKKLEELVAGLDGVSPGPWRLKEMVSDGEEYRAEICGDIFVLMDFNGPAYPHQSANAAHIARCDPDTIRSISDAYKAMEAENERLREALTPSGETKAAFWGEFCETVEMYNPDYDEDDEDSPESIEQSVPVSWTTIKAIMAAIRDHALKGSRHEG